LEKKRKEERPKPATVTFVERESAWEQKRAKGPARAMRRVVGNGREDGRVNTYVYGEKNANGESGGNDRRREKCKEREKEREREREEEEGKREGRDGREREGGRRGNRGKEAGGWIFQAAPPWQRSQRIAMATDPETPSGRRTTIASERASLSDGSNNVSSLSLYSRSLLM